jgi:hypothetical protein
VKPSNIIRIRRRGIDEHGECLLEWRVFRDGEAWVAICDALRLTTFGETWSDLTDSVNDILNHLLIDLLKNGELDRFLVSHGWETLGAPPPATTEHIAFDVPWFPIRSSAHDLDSRRHPH